MVVANGALRLNRNLPKFNRNWGGLACGLKNLPAYFLLGKVHFLAAVGADDLYRPVAVAGVGEGTLLQPGNVHFEGEQAGVVVVGAAPGERETVREGAAGERVQVAAVVRVEGERPAVGAGDGVDVAGDGVIVIRLVVDLIVHRVQCLQRIGVTGGVGQRERYEFIRHDPFAGRFPFIGEFVVHQEIRHEAVHTLHPPAEDDVRAAGLGDHVSVRQVRIHFLCARIRRGRIGGGVEHQGGVTFSGERFGERRGVGVVLRVRPVCTG
jgi:hypothetical protein